MSFSELILVLAIGLVAGFMSGALGIGGAVIVIPALIFFLGFSQHQAQGTSLAMMLPPVAALAVMNYYRSGYVNIKIAALLIVAFFAGSYFGSVLTLKIPARYLQKAFAMLLILVAIRLLLKK